MKILKHAGINRVVTRLNPTTGEPEHCVISDILSSHSARKAFARYRVTDGVAEANAKEIDEDMKRDLVSMLE